MTAKEKFIKLNDKINHWHDKLHISKIFWFSVVGYFIYLVVDEFR